MGNKESDKQKRNLLIIAMIIIAVLWVFAPFAAVNIATLDDQPSAFRLLTGNFFYLGSLVRSPCFWSALLSSICIIICFVCELKNKNKAVKIVAILAELPMIASVLYGIGWIIDDPITHFAEIFGFGFWGIFFLFLVIFFASKQTAQTTSDEK